MRTLIEKELRLLFPAWAAAIALGIFPVWLLPYDPWNPGAYASAALYFGILLLALSSFGREVNMKTLPFLLTQPVERARLWWVKIIILTVFVGTVIECQLLSFSLRALTQPALLFSGQAVAMLCFATVIFTTGGLWMTLLLRQTMAAFWLTLLIPLGVASAIELAGGPHWMIGVVLGVYSISAFFLAKRKFLRVQDTAWTGGAFTFDGVPMGAKKENLREHAPWGALLRKELQLHQITMVGIGCLFVLHLGVLVIRKVGANSLGHMPLAALQMFGGLWLIVPFLAGSQSVADERQLGTLDSLLCLPVSRRTQFVLKLVFVLAIGGLLAGALLNIAERIGHAIGVGTQLDVAGVNFAGHGSAVGIFIFVLLALMGFFASSLTRGTIPALAVGIIGAVGWWQLEQARWTSIFGVKLWHELVFYPLLIAIIGLAHGNFRYVFETGRRWRHNIFILIAVLAGATLASGATYHRFWEFLLPFQEMHGTAKLPKAPMRLDGENPNAIAVVLSGGRLWESRTDFWDSDSNFRTDYRFERGSNWLTAIVCNFETVALKSDGTLWISEKTGFPPREKISPLVQFGTETNWQSVVQNNFSLYLLKKDGTLWMLERPKSKSGISELRTGKLHQLGTNSEWAQILQCGYRVFAWKQNGSAWRLARNEKSPRQGSFLSLDAEITAVPTLPLNDMRVKQMSSCGAVVALRKDGSLCSFKPWLPQTAIQGLGSDSDWVSIAGENFHLVGLKSDGTIWLWDFEDPHQPDHLKVPNVPTQMGTHDDWIAVGAGTRQGLTLAADGSLWGWEWYDKNPVAQWQYADQWLAPSRRPRKLTNILDAQR